MLCQRRKHVLWQSWTLLSFYVFRLCSCYRTAVKILHHTHDHSVIKTTTESFQRQHGSDDHSAMSDRVAEMESVLRGFVKEWYIYLSCGSHDSSTPSDLLTELEQFKFCLYVYRSMEMHERKKLVFKYLFSGMLFKPLNIYIPVL